LAVEATVAYEFTLFEKDLMMNNSDSNVRTLEEALQEPR